jgi:integrase/recombinase XerD
MIKYLTKNQVSSLFAVINDPRDKALIACLYYLGLRRSELCNLEFDDINLANSTIHIKALKNGIEGDHYLNPKCCELIKDYLVTRRQISRSLPYLFLGKNKNYTRLDPSSVYRIYAKYAKLAGLPNSLYNPHCLRHSLATALLSSGQDLGLVKDTLRHKSISSTVIYTNIMTEVKIEMQKNAFENSKYLA